VLTKWRRSAKIHARELTTDFSQLPKFNWDGPADWPRQRYVLNRLSPLLFLPYVPVVLLLNVWNERRFTPLARNVRMAFYQGLYAGMVQYYVAKYTYLGGVSSPATEAPRPGSGGR